ncbi:MAG TPA: integrin alpha [Planctomycetota bacterium]|nr:integrin alpha [Planctomycetota bacterium]
MVACLRRGVSGFALLVLAGAAAAQFDQFGWTFSPGGAGSGGNVTPTTMTIDGADGSFCSGGSTAAFTSVAPYDLLISADYTVTNQDKGGSSADYLVTIVNGEETMVSGQCFGCQLVLEVPAGATFGFGVHSFDCVFGPAQAVLTHLLVQPAPGELTAPGVDVGGQFGAALTALADLNGDGVPEVAVGAPLAAGSKGRVTTHDGSNLAVVRTLVGVNSGDHLGSSLAVVGDLDGDGVVDLLAGAPDMDIAGHDAGAARLYSGFTGALLDTVLAAAAGAGDHFGRALVSPGDVDGDGVDDLLIGAPQHDGTGTDSGRAELLSGATGALLGAWDGLPGDTLGSALAGLGDVDGDGVPDLLIGSPKADVLAKDSGLAQMISGATGAVLHDLAQLPCNGDAGDEFGTAVASVGDVDGDGVPDAVMSAPGDDCIGYAEGGSLWLFSGADAHELWHLNGADVGANLGVALAGPGDVDGNGVPDILVGSPLAVVPAQTGKALLLDGGDGHLLLGLHGDSPGDFFGAAVAGAGDTDGDGLPDLLVGRPELQIIGPGSVHSVHPAFLWTDLGHALAGSAGLPQLAGQGLLLEGWPLKLTLSSTAPGKPTTLVIGLQALAAPFKGGVMVPDPDLLLTGLVSSASKLELAVHQPAGIPPGTQLYLQMWLVDAAGPKGLAASNALHADFP